MRKRELLPDNYHMAIVEIHQRFYPVLTSKDGQELTSFTELFWSTENSHGIPTALGPRHTTGLISFPTYADAINFCHRKREASKLCVQWEAEATRCEVYPERNAWYADEIQALTGEAPRIRRFSFEVQAIVTCKDGIVYGVDALTIDEAMIRLYESVAHGLSSEHTGEHQVMLLEALF
ncbi:hypothetical protein [Dictyobacter aurantiacus]|uniref:Uncharacterized protein n=1 Tax=Dictyobacter aurantiacus TaxID=1936993 RepID=A0A401ZD69_9CHLR|nr:hypothetical protein [Dictyobacter aurantiacus]GCE04776.1 hypothetical protein KDAU_21050 [Dictyobacter aurantiacus]